MSNTKLKRRIARFLISIALCLLILLIYSIYLALQNKENPLSINENKKSEKIMFEEGKIELCFSMQEDCSNFLAREINSSNKISAALYDLDDEKTIENLKGKNSDVLIDEDNFNNEKFSEWQKISTPGLMHNKFFILEQENKIKTITGSTNPTYNDFFKNDNNMILIESKIISNNYLEEFYELKNKKPQTKTKNKIINLSGIIIENYFCPEDNCEEEVISEIKIAKLNIYFMVFSFTSDPIGTEIMKKYDDKISVKGIFDKSQVSANKEYSEFFKMNRTGIDVKIEQSSGKLHHKVFIIDNKTVIAGSYNPSASGNERNEENILIIHDETITQEYLREFERIWQIS